jgi:hypothetical protein
MDLKMLTRFGSERGNKKIVRQNDEILEVELTCERDVVLGKVKIKKGIFQVDSLLPLFVCAMIPLTHILNQKTFVKEWTTKELRQ